MDQGLLVKENKDVFNNYFHKSNEILYFSVNQDEK